MKSLIGILNLKIAGAFIFLLLIVWLIHRWRIKKRLNLLSDKEISRLSTEKTNSRQEERWRLRIIGEMTARSRKRKKKPTGHKYPD